MPPTALQAVFGGRGPQVALKPSAKGAGSASAKGKPEVKTAPTPGRTPGTPAARRPASAPPTPASQAAPGTPAPGTPGGLRGLPAPPDDREQTRANWILANDVAAGNFDTMRRQYFDAPISFLPKSSRGKLASILRDAIASDVKSVREFDAFIRAEIAAGRMRSFPSDQVTVASAWDDLVRKGLVHVNTPIPAGFKRIPVPSAAGRPRGEARAREFAGAKARAAPKPAPKPAPAPRPETRRRRDETEEEYQGRLEEQRARRRERTERREAKAENKNGGQNVGLPPSKAKRPKLYSMKSNALSPAWTLRRSAPRMTPLDVTR